MLNQKQKIGMILFFNLYKSDENENNSDEMESNIS